MSHTLNLESAKLRLLEAQAGLEAYMISENKNIVQHKELADALRRAIDDLLNQVIESSPTLQ